MGRAASKRSSAGSEVVGAHGPGTPAGAPELSIVVGLHVRRFRKELGLSLRGLAARSGLSIGFLSQLERGLTSISLTTLRDLAVTLERDITEFFDEAHSDASGEAAESSIAQVIDTVTPSAEAAPPVSVERYFTLTRSSGEHTTQFLSGERTYRLLSKRAPGLVLEPMLVQIAPGDVMGEMEVHGGEEFAYVIEGELIYVVDGTTHRLTAGDSLHLKSTIPHCLYNDTDQVTTVVSVVSPRLF